MAALYLIPPVIGFVLLSAHFFRAENQLAALASAALIILVLVRRPWAVRTMQACLLLGSLEWLRSTLALVMARSEIGAPFLRLAIILGCVAMFTALSSLVFRTGRLKDHFGLGPVTGAKEGA
jgi:hypothetical protein